MSSCFTRIEKFSPTRQFRQEFRTGVSLHSHTMHSKEFLGRLPAYIAKVPIGCYLLEREIGRSHLYTGQIYDFNKFFWTPPLSPQEAHDLEKKQIEARLGLPALVSLTDHDNIQAGIQLRVLEATSSVPISLEWTVPYEQTEFHLGIHNLPPSRATGWGQALTACSSRTIDLFGLLAQLHSEPDVLIVLNHPYWDARGIGQVRHRKLLQVFFEKFLPFLHAVEVNGMRPRRENREVVVLGEEVNLPWSPEEIATDLSRTLF